MRCDCSGAMPMPVSRTSIHTVSPRSRAVTVTPPCTVYLRALSIRLDSMRCSSCGSLRTHRPLARTRSCSSFCSACAEKVWLSGRNSASSSTGCGDGVMTPASSRETSSMVSSEAPSAFTARIRRSALRLSGRPRSSFSSAAPNSAMACSGWRRSWLAAPRKRVFSSLARSVAAICSPRRAASASFSKRSMGESVSSRCWRTPACSVSIR
ncbi:hypothetical protein D9M69_463750 [compost metagenome]